MHCVQTRRMEGKERPSTWGRRGKMAREEETQTERAREHDSIKEFISNSLPPHKGADLDPWKSRTALCFGSLSLCVRKQEHLTTTAQRINLSCKMPVGHVWRFVGCVCCSRLISAWRCRRTKHRGWCLDLTGARLTHEENQRGETNAEGEEKAEETRHRRAWWWRERTEKKNSSHHMSVDKTNCWGWEKLLWFHLYEMQLIPNSCKLVLFQCWKVSSVSFITCLVSRSSSIYYFVSFYFILFQKLD